jgi:hypothetical protein
MLWSARSLRCHATLSPENPTVRYLIIGLLILGGCSSQKVIDAGAGRYSLTATSTHGVLAARDRAVKLANRYCGRNGQQAVIESFEDQRLAGVVGDPTSSVVFTCGLPNTTAFIR